MIPKVIHYCWFGHNPLPELAKKCIASWKRYLPDYQIKEWNEENFDVHCIPYTHEAYEAKKYAFVSDYARFWILYHYGGIYFDTDVEVIKPIDDIVERGAFMGCETNGVTNSSMPTVNPGLGLGASPGLNIYKELLDLYASLSFKKADGSLNLQTIVHYTTSILIQHGLKPITDICQCGEIWIYPQEYFCPKNYTTKKIKITKKSYTIHHYAESWISPWTRFKYYISRKIGPRWSCKISQLKRIIRFKC